jgi:cytochrome c-type biogenesis protein CcmH
MTMAPWAIVLVIVLVALAGLAIGWRVLRARASGPDDVPWRWTGLLTLACVPAVVAVTVAYVMTSDPVTAAAKPGGPAREAPHASGGNRVADTAAQLAARVRDNPEDAQGWVLLGRSLAAAGRFAEAADALGEAARRMPGNASVLAERADLLAMSRGRRFEGEPDRLIEAALALEPRHVKALALAGTSAYAKGDFAAAAAHWRRLLEAVPPRGDLAREVEANVREAELRAASGPAAARLPRPPGS